MSGARSISIPTAATFAATAALLVAYAVDGGSYDIVARQEFGLLIWWALLVAAAAGLLPARRPGAPVVVVIFALAALALWTAASFSWSQSDERTLTELARVLHHLGLFLLVVVVAGRERWIAVAGGATAAAAIVCGLALGTRLAPGTFGVDKTARAFETNRLSSPLGYWNAVGAWTAMTTVLLLAWSAHARTAVVRALALAAVPAVLLTLYLTYSRASVADLVVGVVLIVLLARRRWTTALHTLAGLALGGTLILVVRSHPQIADFTGTAGRGQVLGAVVVAALAGAAVALATLRLGLDRVRLAPSAGRATFAAVGAIAALGLVVAAFTVIPPAWHDFKQPYGATNTSDPAARFSNLNSGRYQIYSSAISTFRANPLKGTGAGTFEFSWNGQGRTDEFLRDAHSLYLEPFSELGLLGGLLVLLFTAGVIATIAAARRRVAEDEHAAGVVAGVGAACGAYLVAAGVDWMWEVTAVTALFLVLAGTAGAVTLRDAAPLRRPARWALALVALACAAVMLPGLLSASELQRSSREVVRGDLPAAAAAARKAEQAGPWAASPHLQLALIDEQAGDLEGARAQLRAAGRREPTNWRVPFILSRVEAARGDAAAALKAYREARALRPRGAFFLDPTAATAAPAG